MTEDRPAILSKDSFVPLGVAASLVVGAVAMAWQFSNFRSETHEAISEMSHKIELQLVDISSRVKSLENNGDGRFSRSDFREWIKSFKYANSYNDSKMVVPELENP